MISLDLTGAFLTCQAAGRVMLQQRYGRIVNLSSFHTVATYPQRAAYAAAKMGVNGLTQALAVEWGGRGVTVNTVAPAEIAGTADVSMSRCVVPVGAGASPSPRRSR